MGIEVAVERLGGGEWSLVGEGFTDGNGRISDLGVGLSTGTYRLRFATGSYGNRLYPEVTVVVSLDEAEDHYHIPLLLSPFGYTTYRGS